jgi:hypothetical protein
MKDVFVSYAREDEDYAHRICGALRWAGLDVWLDAKELKAGQNWEMEIRQAISGSKTFVACLSSTSVTKKGFVQSELKQALGVLDRMPDGQVYIIPVRLDDCPIPPSLRGLHCIDVFEEGALSHLVSSIVEHVNERQGALDPSSKALRFSRISIHSGDLNWAELPLPENTVFFGYEYRQFFNLVEFVHDGDMVLDITVVSQVGQPLLLTHIGVEIIHVGHLAYAYGIPRAAKIKLTDSLELEMPDLKKRLPRVDEHVLLRVDEATRHRIAQKYPEYQRDEFSERAAEALDCWQSHRPSPFIGGPEILVIAPVRLNELVDHRIADPIYFEPQAPYRFSLRLRRYTERMPNHSLIRLRAETDAGAVWSHPIRTFTW